MSEVPSTASDAPDVTRLSHLKARNELPASFYSPGPRLFAQDLTRPPMVDEIDPDLSSTGHPSSSRHASIGWIADRNGRSDPGRNRGDPEDDETAPMRRVA